MWLLDWWHARIADTDHPPHHRNRGATVHNVYQSLLMLIAGATQKELARQIKYLKVENEILRSKLPDRVAVTPTERSRLVRFACKLGNALNALVSIVHPDTLRRWIRESKRAKTAPIPRRRGRPRTDEEIRTLIVKLATENSWGFTRILGELKKLRIKPPSRNTIKNILREHGLKPGPKRGEGTWDEFVKRHAATLWQCDFFSKKVLTFTGWREMFVLVFLHVETRRVFITPATQTPNEAWTIAQCQALVQHTEASQLGATFVIHDRDTKFTDKVDATLQVAGLEVRKTPPHAPNTNAYVERFIQTIKHECLDHFIVFGADHLDFLILEMTAYYHEERPHQGRENETLMGKCSSASDGVESATIPLTEIRCRERLGGLLKHYTRKVA